jgi:hypothetical protein
LHQHLAKGLLSEGRGWQAFLGDGSASTIAPEAVGTGSCNDFGCTSGIGPGAAGETTFGFARGIGSEAGYCFARCIGSDSAGNGLEAAARFARRV